MKVEISREKVVSKKNKKTSRLIFEIRKNRFAYALVLPAFIAMLIIHFIPMVQGIYMSFLKLNQFTLNQFLKAPFVGLQNYYTVLFDKSSTLRSGFMDALRNTIIYALSVNILVLVIGMISALLVNRKFKFRGLARTLLLTPWVVPSYVVGMLWGFMWQQDTGIINRILVDWLHILPDKPFWLSGPNTLWAIIIPTVWRSTPFIMIMLLAGLQNIPEDYYEAAEIDGASSVQKFRHITLPLLRPIIAVNLLHGMITHIYSFNIVAMMFGHGAGFPGKWGDLLMTNINRNSFGIWQMGTGAAATIVVMIIVLSIVGIWYRVFREDLVVEE
ncbi:MAG TPA: sugar ABC transporter permease [Defluviitaleaceae bacterium]|nr:sugar ABC transporter permease [Candidatus Epulonipiscium sp.]HOQ16950.1 sugar ABC transporter permease [Defluviitaleaceae bacterium]HPT75743.1 sugar ABC transporter permease [Defluviitaleaceae bacterium]HQD49972.1 sugar ABC transporter permease [Defluviitaleaceae bacterium]